MTPTQRVKAIDECLQVLRPSVMGKFPQEQALEELAGYLSALAEPAVQEPVSWGVDWGSHGDRSCVSIVKQHANGTLEVIATEYGPAGSAPQAQQPQLVTNEEMERLREVRDEMKRQWGVDSNVSFDTVWAEALALKKEAK